MNGPLYPSYASGKNRSLKTNFKFFTFSMLVYCQPVYYPVKDSRHLWSLLGANVS